MASNIDPTKPVDGVPAVKSDLRANLQAAKDEIEALQGASGVSTFTGLTDTPSTYTSQANKYVRVNAGATALEFIAQAAGGDASTTTFTQAGTGAVASTVQAKLREFDVSVTDFGAVGDGVADDTAAIQDAIDYLATTLKTGHSRMLMRGKFKYTPASLVWTAFEATDSGLTMYVDGELLPQGGPVILDKNRHVVGIGGNVGVQFQRGPICGITAASGQVGLWMRNHGNHIVENVAVYGADNQPAILCTGSDSSQEGTLGSLYRLQNVGVSPGRGIDADCMRVSNIFWLWMDNFALMASAGVSVVINENSFPATGWVEESTNVWYAPQYYSYATAAAVAITAAPSAVYHDGATLSLAASKVAMDTVSEWWWDDVNDRVYVYSTTNPAGSGWAFNVYDVDATAISKASGIFYIENGVIAGRGIRFRQTQVSGPGYAGNAVFRNVVTESMHTAMFTLDTVDPVDWLNIERCFMADSVVPPTVLIETMNVRANQVVLQDCGAAVELPCRGPAPRNLRIERKPREGITTNTRKLTYDGTYPRRGVVQIDGEQDGRDAFRNAEMLPNLIAATNLGALQDATAWSNKSTGFDVTGGQTAPDGSATAYLIAYGAGTGALTARAYDNGSTPMTDGDYLIAGCWFKSAVAGQRLYLNDLSVLTLPSNPPLLDGSAVLDLGNNELCAFGDMGWVLIVEWAKWTGANAGWLIWTFNTDQSGYDYYVWKPFLLRVDASIYNERDVARMAARFSIVAQDAKPGVLTQLAHQTFRTGIGATGSRPSASAVGEGAQWFDATLNKPIWSDGTVWRDAAGADMT